MSKKLATSSLAFQALEKFIETQNKKKNSIPVRAFSENPPFCIFYYINPVIGGPWGILWIFFLLAIFIMHQKNAFGQKKFQISCTGS